MREMFVPKLWLTIPVATNTTIAPFHERVFPHMKQNNEKRNDDVGVSDSVS